MAQFDVYRLDDVRVVDCQSNLLDRLETRFVVPLLAGEQRAVALTRLNPMLEVDGEDMILMPQLASSIEKRALGQPVASLSASSLIIIDAIDVLLSGV